MDRNYCFRRKRHSYAACDAALAASYFNINTCIVTTDSGVSDLRGVRRCACS